MATESSHGTLTDNLRNARLDAMPEILFEDNHLFVINKPCGVLTHGDSTGDPSLEEIVKSYIKEAHDKPGRVFAKSVHRLDRPVSGVIVFAKTSKAHERLSKQFKHREVDKRYLALVMKEPKPANGTVRHFLSKNARRNMVDWHTTPGNDRKEAVTDYRVLGHAAPYYLIDLVPRTGRSHQLRVALRSKRCPIVGDRKYRGRRIENPRAIMLHAHRISFAHPVGQRQLTIRAPVPDLVEWQCTYAVLPKLIN